MNGKVNEETEKSESRLIPIANVSKNLCLQGNAKQIDLIKVTHLLGSLRLKLEQGRLFFILSIQMFLF